MKHNLPLFIAFLLGLAAGCSQVRPPWQPADGGQVQDGGLMSKGAACTAAVSCLSGFCEQGVCCDRACPEPCHRCDLHPQAGICMPVIGLKGTPRRLSFDGASSKSPALAWTGSDYGLIWSDQRAGGGELYFRRLALDGTVLGAPLRVTHSGVGAISPALAWTGSEYGLGWFDLQPGGTRIAFRRLSKEGAPLDLWDIEKVTSTEDLHLLWTGSRYTLSWHTIQNTRNQIFFSRRHPDGTRLGEVVELSYTPDHAYLHNLTWTGSEYGLAWTDTRSGTDRPEIYFSRISPGGVIIGYEFRITQHYAVHPSLVWNGNGHALLWFDYGRDALRPELYFRRQNPYGTIQGGARPLTSGAQDQPMIARFVWSGSEYGLLWTDRLSSTAKPGLHFKRLGSMGQILSEGLLIDGVPATATFSALVWTGSEYSFSWHDDRDGNREIYFARICY